MKLIVENLSLERGGQTIVSNISFEVHAGEALIVTGENGAGKSTTLRGVAGLLPISAGSITLLDETGKVFENPVKEYCHYLGHENSMKSALSVKENLEFWRNFCTEPDLTVEEALEEVGLVHTLDLPFHYLSSGQKRRVAIARLLITDRPIWILDEPTSGFDAHSVKMFSNLCQTFCEGGGILIAATHLDLDLGSAKTLEIKAQ